MHYLTLFSPYDYAVRGVHRFYKLYSDSLSPAAARVAALRAFGPWMIRRSVIED